MTVEVVFFDVGGVLLDMSGQERRSIWARRLGISEAALEQAVWDAVGFRTKRDLPAIGDRLVERLEIEHQQVPGLLGDFSAHWVRNEELAEFLISLRPTSRLAVIGNIPSSGRFAFETVLHLDDIFEAMFLSGELGVDKPDPRIYEVACRTMNVDPRHAIFVDDRLENVEGARAIGIRAHQHVNNADTIAWISLQLNASEIADVED